MQLREEILLILKEEKFDIYNSRYETTVNQIVSMIEKRIDSIEHQSTTTGYLWAIGFNDAIKKVKEMLK